MPTLDWIGKKAVVNHHRDVPYRLIHCDRDKSAGDPDAGNLLVQGDNLEALKALLPYYAGKVKCIYIDPPYNTGNEGWVYNDNVNSPEIKAWLGATVGKEAEDLSRHDKWLCMMYPRLRLLKEFLSGDGFIAVSIDDNEIFALGNLLDEVFLPSNRLVCAPWKSEPSGGKQKSFLRVGHEYLLIYARSKSVSMNFEENDLGVQGYEDKFGKYIKGREFLKWGAESERHDRKDMWFRLFAPDGTVVWPYRNDGKEGRWRVGAKNSVVVNGLIDPTHMHWEKRAFDKGVTIEGSGSRWVPYEKIRETKKYFGWGSWLDTLGSNADATEEIKRIFGEKLFDTPKPTSLVKWVIGLAGEDDCLVMDSFAGSATTAHSVLAINKEDGGSRKFVCIEMSENVVSEIASKRISQVIDGYEWLDRKGNRHSAEGTGSGFRFCTLGEPLFDADGNVSPAVTFPDLAAHVFFCETGSPIPRRADGATPLIGAFQGRAIYLLHNAESAGVASAKAGNVLTSAALETLPLPEPGFSGARIVYGEGCTVPEDRLSRLGVTFKQVPYQIEGL